MKPFRPGRRSLTQIFAWPLAVGALSTVGLVSALVGDGVWDGLSFKLAAGAGVFFAHNLMVAFTSTVMR